ncbi:MAG: 16S rRNA (cytidine(1402)-2'-O)-methyltransferase [Alphaproteobacteria bacterium]|nr:16S rRNA (cytidine(1402)-2'-O)-methyltransferase [Alphaproteobacteria bacterium]MBN2675613.1 16S rRNA (cytidine(1402)-2'-O)-methyltransferase [Alphaproteobacteria bacterium]
MQTGLYVVGTPIGNLSDMSPRAIETLKNMDLIACEDTRVFGKLGSHFDIQTKKISFHEHNEKDSSTELVEKIKDGMKIALVSDAGMPGISDPGFRLVRECRNQGVDVFVIPGPTAVMSALILSGFPTDRFTFCGFFDEKKIAADNKIRHTIIYYESPNRIMNTISILAKIMPERRIAIVREITKMFEETIIGYPADLLNITPPRGEIVIVIEPAPEYKMSDSEISEIVNDVVSNSTKSAAADIAVRAGISKKEAYKRLINK